MAYAHQHIKRKPISQNHYKEAPMSLKRTYFIAALSATALIASHASAGAAVEVTKDSSLRVGLAGSANAVVVSNPNIADVTVVDSRTVFILGRGLGTTSITITDAMGRSIWDADVTVTLGKAALVNLYRGTTPTQLVCKDSCETMSSQTNSAPVVGSSATIGQ
jgi:Flp pilus assembly secretin CpaC